MRVLYLNCVSDTPEIHLMLGLHKAGVTLATVQDPRDSRITMLREAGIASETVTIKNRFDFSFDSFLRRKIKEFRPDIVHATTSRGLASAIRVLRKDESIKLFSYRGTLGNLSPWSIPARLAHLHPRLDGIFCNCESVKRYLMTVSVPAEKLFVVYKGHAKEWYTQGPPVTRSELQIAEDATVVGFFANIRPLKGGVILAKAIAGVASNRPIVCLMVGEMRDNSLAKFVKKHSLQERIRFLGFSNSVGSLMRLCNVTVMPSIRREGFPRAVVESYCNETPAVCTTVGGMPEIIDDGVTGALVAPRSVTQLQAALQSVVDEPDFWKVAGQKGLCKIESQLSLQTYVANTIDAFQHAMEK